MQATEQTKNPVKQIVMTSPASFGVQYEINPWMTGNEGQIDVTLAVQQWSNLRNALLHVNADVVVMPKPPENCPDAVFTANAGIIYQGKFFPSHFRFPERQAEEPYFIDWFREHGFDVVIKELEAGRDVASFEGAGDALLDRHTGILWYGHGFRSTLSFKPVLDEFYSGTGIQVKPVRLTDPRWYHIDTAFCPLDNGMVLWYPPAFDMYAEGAIVDVYGHNAISVTEEDALAFACNAVSVGDNLVLPLISDHLRDRLVERGINPIQIDLSQYKKSGGSAKCLTIEVNE